MKFDKVLVPIDGSVLSKSAIDLALNSAKAFNANLTFVYVVDVTEYGRFGNVDANMTAMMLKAEGKLAIESIKGIAEKYGVEYKAVIVEGVPWQVISEMSKEQDMIIMGVTGKAGIGAGRIGGTAEKVVENSYCPVLTLKSGSAKMESILLPVSNEHMAAIDLAIDSAKNSNSKITVLAVRGRADPSALVDTVIQHIKDAGVTNVDYLIENGDIADVIIGESGKYDLVIMGTEGRHGLKKILNGSVAEKVMTGAACPVTIIRDR